MRRHPPDAAVLVVRNVERPVRSHREPGRTICRPARLFECSGETVCESNRGPGGLAVLERLKDDVVATLRRGSAIPRSVESNKGPALISRGEGLSGVDQKIIGGPMCGKECNGRLFVRANANLGTAIAAVLGRQHEFLLRSVEIAFGPAVVAP